ncbi:MAG: serine/threonine-protein kinase, partial [Gemmatimonadaceae bacterium]
MTPDIAARLNSALAERYRIDRELGAGGMATVYLAHDLKHDRDVAIKVLKPELGEVLGAERFLAEIKVTANLRHPNLLPLFDSGDADGLLFYVMPYIEGQTLRARMQLEQQLPVDDTLRIIALLASALDYAHARGVIHRDLKPENILLQAGQPLIADFGIALAVAHAGGDRITQTGISLGTPHYMSPEQAAGDRAVDARSDQYALGAIAYEALTGEPPHTGATAQVLIARLMTEAPRSVRGARPSVSASVDAAVLRALSKAPADRFASCGDLSRALAVDAQHTSPALAAPRRSRALAGMAAGAVIFFALAALFVVSRRDGRLTAATTPGASIAVLPFTDLSPDHTNAFLGDGVAETLINALVNVPGLSVAARTSAFSFRDKAGDVR